MPRHLLAILLVFAALFATTPAHAQDRVQDRVRVQMMWTHQAQFAGFYAAVVNGFYERERLAVDLVEGGPGIDTLKQLTDGRVDVAMGWLPAAIEARQSGHDVVNIAQIFQRSGTAIICRRDMGVRTAHDVAGKTFGVWNVGDERNIAFWLKAVGVAPDSIKLMPQRPNGQDLIEGRAACITAMQYNEYWTLLRSGLKPADLFMVRLGDEGFGFLEDGLYVMGGTLTDAKKRDVLVRFLRATFRGWRHVLGNTDEALAITMSFAPRLDPFNQRRMLDSVVGLIGDTKQLGLLDLASVQRSLDILGGDGSRSVLARAFTGGWTHQVWRDAGPGADAFMNVSVATRHYLNEAVNARWFYSLDLIGTVAFGLAGFMRAQQRRYDLWGALILTMLPAVAGGTLRDLMIGGDRHPPFIFKDPMYMYIVLEIVVIGTLAARFTPDRFIGSRDFDRVLTFFDTAGLATFTVIGAKVALLAGLNWVWIPFCAALTCAGGGMLLDIVTGREPRTFQGEPYEEIAIAGGLFLLLALNLADWYEHAAWAVTASMLATMALVFTLRMLVVTRGWRSYRLGHATVARGA
jgi:NitT/TauT family transport system substrate-binding protein